MTAAAQLMEMVDHLEWANDRVWGAVEAGSSRAAERLWVHLLAAERVWLDRVERGETTEAVWPDALPGGGRADMGESVSRIRALLTDGGDLERPISYTNTRGQAFVTPLRQILVHLTLHGAYHRGQIAQSLRASGDEPVGTDFIQYVRAP